VTSPAIRAHGCHFPIDHDVVPTGDNLSDSTVIGRVICGLAALILDNSDRRLADVSILCALVHLRTNLAYFYEASFFMPTDPRQRGPRAPRADLSETRMVQGVTIERAWIHE
jgi:hypothetical protein